MSKSLPSVLPLFSVIGLLGCDPVIASVAEVTAVDQDGAVIVRDAGTRPASDGTIEFSELDDPEGCVLLADQSIPEVIEDAAAAPQRLVVGRTGAAAGCVGPDAGVVLLSASVFRRLDNEPMVEEGATYSYRWDATTTMSRVNLMGGDSICDTKSIVFKEHGLVFPGTGAAVTVPATCYQFTSPIEARYVRLTGGDYIDPGWLNLGKTPALFKLCRAKCPAGTEHFFDDASVPATAPYLNDAGMYVLPGITGP